MLDEFGQSLRNPIKGMHHNAREFPVIEVWSKPLKRAHVSVSTGACRTGRNSTLQTAWRDRRTVKEYADLLRNAELGVGNALLINRLNDIPLIVSAEAEGDRSAEAVIIAKFAA